MSNFKDLTGHVLGRLTIICRSDKNKWGSAMWDCVCLCGKKTTVDSHSLKRGGTRSCGCLRTTGFSDETLSSKHALYAVYRNSARRRGLSFSISFDELLDQVQKNCYYCGDIPKRYFKPKSSRKGFYANGVDRVDNDVGYEKSNIVACCTDCNQAKNSLPKEDFINWIKRCHSYLNSRGL